MVPEAPTPEVVPTDLEKVQAIRRFRSLELIGDLKVTQRDAYLQAKGWARQLGINWVFSPADFDPEAVLSHIRRMG
jgi:hypothetical protein